MSALDRIRQQQVDTATTLANSTAQKKSLPALAPAVGGIRQIVQNCAPRNQGKINGIASSPAGTLSKDDFLASKRVRIGKTNFDRDWKRVRRESVRGTLRRQFGRGVTPSHETIGKINRWVNSEIAYVEDKDLFARADYWAGARRTLRLGKGDCEDIALTKMQLLAAAGISRNDMFLTIARDRVRNADHALLVIRFKGRFIILDNTTDHILDGTPSHDYAPVLSFNNRTAWIHGY